MLEPHVLIALREFYQVDFAVSETPPSPEDSSVVSVKYANHYLLFDWHPGLKILKVNPNAIAATVNRLRKEAIEGEKVDEIEATYGEVFDKLNAKYGRFAAFAYAEILSGNPGLLVGDDASIAAWRSSLELESTP